MSAIDPIMDIIEEYRSMRYKPGMLSTIRQRLIAILEPIETELTELQHNRKRLGDLKTLVVKMCDTAQEEVDRIRKLFESSDKPTYDVAFSEAVGRLDMANTILSEIRTAIKDASEGVHQWLASS